MLFSSTSSNQFDCLVASLVDNGWVGLEVVAVGAVEEGLLFVEEEVEIALEFIFRFLIVWSWSLSEEKSESEESPPAGLGDGEERFLAAALALGALFLN